MRFSRRNKSGREAWFLVLGKMEKRGESSELSFFPLWDYERDGSRSSYNVMLAAGGSKGPDERRRYLFPLWYYERDGYKRTFASLPCSFHRDVDGSHVNVGLLAGQSKSDDTLIRYLLPLAFYKRHGDAHFLGTPIGASWGDGPRQHFNVLLLAGRSKDRDSESHYLLPAWWYRRKGPERQLLSLPYSFREDGASRWRNVAGLVFNESTDGNGSFRSFLWPLAHVWKSARSQGHALLPAYAFRRYGDDEYMFNSLLFNRRRGKDSEMLNVGGPLFIRTNNDDGEYFTSLLWPIYQHWGSPGINQLLLAPLLYRRSADGESYTNDDEWAMFKRRRFKDTWHSASIPVRWFDPAANRLARRAVPATTSSKTSVSRNGWPTRT